MKIVAVATILVHLPYVYDGPRHNVGGKDWNTMDILLIRVDTDAGITGWGEAFGHGANPTTRTALDTLVAPLFIGADPCDISALMLDAMQKLHLFGRNGPVTYALSGIDIALWDIAGKRANLPLSQLLGGARRARVPAYASLLRYGDPATVARNAARAVAEGYRAIKLHEIGAVEVHAARQAIGPDILLMNDCNCPWSVAEALRMAEALRPANLHWLEEPVWPPEDHAGLARVRAAGVPIAAGENAAGLHDFLHLFQAGAVDVAQPSVTKIGGITEARKIYALAEAFGVRVVPHCAYFGPGFLASLHLAATLGAPPLERLFVDLDASPFSPWTEVQDGWLAVPDAPGLGCDPDMDVVERYRRTPITVTQ